MRSRYWSCSKFADWLRGTDKISAGTSEEWNDWDKTAKSKYPFRYWLAEEGLDLVQDFIFWPASRWNDIRYYINNRWITRSHCLTAHSRDIKPGQWRDVGDRFLPCLFNELVDFVEVEQAWHHVVFDDEARKQFNPPWWRTSFLRLRTWRSPEAGVAHLEWASGLVADDSWGMEPSDKGYGEPTYQAINAKEVLTLYRWWTEVYLNRPDPHDASGWSKYCDLSREENGGSLSAMLSEDKDPKLKKMSNVALKKLRKIEDQYEKEDNEMLIRLIKVRRSLWT
jgi:hypothetical protein